MSDDADRALDFLLRSVTAERQELYRYQRRQTETNRRRWEAASEALGAAKYRAREVLEERSRADKEEMWATLMEYRR
jgi:hypothetical protein